VHVSGVCTKVKIPMRPILATGTAGRGKVINNKYKAVASVKYSCSQIHNVTPIDKGRIVDMDLLPIHWSVDIRDGPFSNLGSSAVNMTASYQ
jgi:hypothetical protein